MGNSESALAKQQRLALSVGALPLKILPSLINSKNVIPSSDWRIDIYISCPQAARPPASDLVDIIDAFCRAQNLGNAVTIWLAGVCDADKNCTRDKKIISERIEASRYVLFIPPMELITKEDRELCIFELNCACKTSASLHMHLNSIERLGEALRCAGNEIVDLYLPLLASDGYSCPVAEKGACEYESDEPESVCCGWINRLGDTTTAGVVLQSDDRTLADVATLLRSLSLKAEIPLPVDKTASLAEKSGAFDQAKRLRQQAHSTLEALLGPHHPNTLKAQRELCLVLLKLKRYDESVEQLGQCLRGYEKVYGDTHRCTLQVVGDLAQGLRRSGELQKARQIYERAINGDLEFDLNVMLGYAAVLNSLGQLSESEHVLRKVIDVVELKTTLSDESIVPEGIIDALTKLVAVLKAQGKLVDAKTFSQKLLAIQEHRMGKDDIEVLGTMNIIAGIELVESEKERSSVSLQSTRELLATVLTGYQKALGRDHTRALYVENNLASLCDQMGDLSTAKFLYERAMSGQQKVLDSTKINSFRTHYNYGNLLKKIGEQHKAMEMHLSALEGFTNILGPDHPCTQMAAAALEDVATSCVLDRGEVKKGQWDNSVLKTPVRTSRKSIVADELASGVKMESAKNGSGLKKSGIPRRKSPMGNKNVLTNKLETTYLLSSPPNGQFPQSSSTEIDAELWVSEQWMRSKEKAKRQKHQQLLWSETEEAAVMGMAAATTTAVKKLTFDSYSHLERDAEEWVNQQLLHISSTREVPELSSAAYYDLTMTPPRLIPTNRMPSASRPLLSTSSSSSDTGAVSVNIHRTINSTS